MEELAHASTEGPSGQPAPIRRRLGRGLNALLGGGGQEEPLEMAPPGLDSPTDASHINVELIERNPFQPRNDFDEESLGELVESIKLHGVLQPLLVRPNEGGYQLIAGERRLLAARKAALETVPCRVLELDDQHVYEVAIEENLKRKDLNVLEKARAFQDYLERFGASIEELAKRLSMNRSTVSNYLRLLELSEPVKQSLSADRITNGHARALLSLKEAAQIDLCQRIEKESLSVRQTEKEVREILRRGERATIPFPGEADKPDPPQVTNHVRSVQEQLCRQLGVKVEIRLSGENRGKIVIHFDSSDEFEHAVRQLSRAA